MLGSGVEARAYKGVEVDAQHQGCWVCRTHARRMPCMGSDFLPELRILRCWAWVTTSELTLLAPLHFGLMIPNPSPNGVLIMSILGNFLDLIWGVFLGPFYLDPSASNCIYYNGNYCFGERSLINYSR
jgi:hypothetical protein